MADHQNITPILKSAFLAGFMLLPFAAAGHAQTAEAEAVAETGEEVAAAAGDDDAAVGDAEEGMGEDMAAAPACEPVVQAVVEEEVPGKELLTDAFVSGLKEWLDVPVVRMTLESRNETNANLVQADIDRLDQQWVKETGSDDQPIITAVLNSPLSTYLLRVQAGSGGLYPEIFVMDAKGLNAGQSSITTDYWQGDEAKFQKTYDVGDGVVFIDEPEYNDATDTWRAQVNMTLSDEKGQRIGAATVEINLTELARRRKAGI